MGRQFSRRGLMRTLGLAAVMVDDTLTSRKDTMTAIIMAARKRAGIA